MTSLSIVQWSAHERFALLLTLCVVDVDVRNPQSPMGADCLSDVAHLPLPLATQLCGLAGSVGVSPDQVVLLLCFLAAIPLGLIHQKLPSVTLRHVYSVVFGLLFMYVQYGVSALHPLVSATVTYALVQVLPRSHMGIVVFVWSVAYLSASHLYRMWVDYLGYHIDFTTTQMVVTVKMVTFAYNVADGLQMKPDADAADGTRKPLHERPDIAKARAERALTRMPSALEYYSFMFFYAGVLVGPCYEATDYFQTIDGTAAARAGLSVMPSPVVGVLKCLGWAVICYVGVVVSGMMPVMNYVDSDQFLSQPLWYRFFYIWLAVTVGRFKYYFAWFMSESGCVASGLGFNGVNVKTGAVQWDRVNNVDVVGVELGQSIFALTNNWNKGVNNWLKHYVYFRVERPKWLPLDAKTFANVVTKGTSALWHGFYSAYYLFFLSGALINEVNNLTHDVFRPWFLLPPPRNPDGSVVTGKDGRPVEGKGNYPLKYVYDFVGWASLYACMNYLGCAFMLLRWQTSVAAWRSVFFVGHLAPIAVGVVAFLLRPRKSRKPRAIVTVKPGAPDASAPPASPASATYAADKTA